MVGKVWHKLKRISKHGKLGKTTWIPRNTRYLDRQLFIEMGCKSLVVPRTLHIAWDAHTDEIRRVSYPIGLMKWV